MRVAIAPAGVAVPGRDDASSRWSDLLLATCLALFSFASAWTSIQDTPLGVPPDEWAHVSHVNEIAAEGRFIPDYSGSRILPGRSQGNYLGHPPLYYTALGLTGRVLGWDAVEDFRSFRALSAALVALGILLWTLAGRGLGLPSTWLIACIAAVNAIPMFPFLAGSVNNDNMAYLGVAVAFYGFVRLPHWPRAAFYVGALGLTIALLSKATAAVFLCAFLVAWVLPGLRDPGSPFRSRHLLFAALLAGLVSGGYYLYAIAAYGSPFPRVADLYSTLPPPAAPLALGPFAIEFAKIMATRVSWIMTGNPLEPLGPALRGVLLAMLSLPFVAWLITRRNWRSSAQAHMALAFMLALVVTVLVHIVVTWNGHLRVGVFAGMQPRYYNYVVPGLFIFGFMAGVHGRVGKALFAGFALAAATLVGVGPSLSTRAQADAVAAAAAPPMDMLHYAGQRSGAERTAVIGVSTTRSGHTDALEVANGSAVARGWAINSADRTPARGVLAIVDGRIIGSAETGLLRPDVGEALQSEEASLAGFRFGIDGLPAGVGACDIELAAEQDDGTIAVLPHAACPREAAQ